MTGLTVKQEELIAGMVTIIQEKAHLEHEMDQCGRSKELTMRWMELNDSLEQMRVVLKSTLH